MGMQACSTPFNAYWLDGEGRIINCYGERVFSSRVWPDEVSADYWLNFVSPDGQFGTAYIAGRISSSTCKAPETLDRWLMRNGLVGSAFDAELLDALPSHLRAVYEKRLEEQ